MPSLYVLCSNVLPKAFASAIESVEPATGVLSDEVSELSEEESELSELSGVLESGVLESGVLESGVLESGVLSPPPITLLSVLLGEESVEDDSAKQPVAVAKHAQAIKERQSIAAFLKFFAIKLPPKKFLFSMKNIFIILYYFNTFFINFQAFLYENTKKHKLYYIRKKKRAFTLG